MNLSWTDTWNDLLARASSVVGLDPGVLWPALAILLIVLAWAPARRWGRTLVTIVHEAGRYAEELSRALAGTQDPIDRLRIYVRQQALIARHFHFPASGPLSEVVSRGTAGRLKAHGALVAQMLASILTDAMDQGLIPAQEPEQVIPLIHATVMGGRPTPSDPEQRRAYLESLDVFVLRAVGARQPAHAVPTIAQPRATEPLEGAQAPGSLRHSAVG